MERKKKPDAKSLTKNEEKHDALLTSKQWSSGSSKKTGSGFGSRLLDSS
jgi:hypothetical protein